MSHQAGKMGNDNYKEALRLYFSCVIYLKVMAQERCLIHKVLFCLTIIE